MAQIRLGLLSPRMRKDTFDLVRNKLPCTRKVLIAEIRGGFRGGGGGGGGWGFSRNPRFTQIFNFMGNFG